MSDPAILELLKQQQEMMQQQQQTTAKILASITSQLSSLSTHSNPLGTEQRLKETIANSIQEFRYDPDNGVTFCSWYRRYEDIFLVDAAALEESAKVRLLIQKLGASEHTQYCNYILPNKPRDFTLKETVCRLDEIFGERTSVFNIRYNCLKLAKCGTEDIVSYAGRVNQECERFQLDRLSNSQFKSLIFVSGLTSPEEADIRTRLLAKLDSSQEPWSRI